MRGERNNQGVTRGILTYLAKTRGGATAHQIIDALDDDEIFASYETIAVLLCHMRKKGYLQKTEQICCEACGKKSSYHSITETGRIALEGMSYRMTAS